MASKLVRSFLTYKSLLHLPAQYEVRCLHRTTSAMLDSWKSPIISRVSLSQVYVDRSLHTSYILCKKMKEELYEQFKLHDHSGEYLCTTEMYVVEKFCYRFHRFTFEQMENVPVGSDRLKSLKLIDTQNNVNKSDAGDNEKRIKTIKFKKDTTGDAKMPKIMESLINTGKVTLIFEKKGCKAEPEVRKDLSKYADFSTNNYPEGANYINAQMKSLDSALLVSLIGTIQAEHSKHIDSVRDMLKVMKEGKS